MLDILSALCQGCNEDLTMWGFGRSEPSYCNGKSEERGGGGEGCLFTMAEVCFLGYSSFKLRNKES